MSATGRPAGASRRDDTGTREIPVGLPLSAIAVDPETGLLRLTVGS